MKDAEFLKMLRSFEFTEAMISRETVFTFVKIVNQNVGQIDRANMNFETYKQINVQVAMHIFSVNRYSNLCECNPAVIF